MRNNIGMIVIVLIASFSTIILKELSFKEGDNMKIKPIGDRVLVKVQESETKTKGGIFIPQTAKGNIQEGIVVAVGEDERIQVKIDDKIFYDRYAGTAIKVESENYLVLKQDNIIAVIEKEVKK